MVLILNYFPVKGLHCLRITTSNTSKETENDDVHTLDVMVRYNGGNTTLFTWKGAKNNRSSNEICEPTKKNVTGLVYVNDVWIRQRSSNNTWFAKSIYIQENLDAPYFAPYAITPNISEFWTDG